MKKFLLFLFFILSIAINAEAEKLTTVILQLNWKYQFEFAGYIAAKEKGIYKKYGLNVIIKQYKSGNPIDDVLNGKADFGVSGSTLFTAMVNRKPVVMLANYFKRSPLVLATKPSIVSPVDLNNKVLLTGGSDIRLTSVGLMIKKFHIHFKKILKIKGVYTLDSFIEGKADAVPIYITNQTYKLNKRHIRYNILDPADYGIYSYSANLFTSYKFFKKHPDIAKKMALATSEGWIYALNHKYEIASLIYKKYSKQKSIDALMFEANKIEGVMMRTMSTVGSINKKVVSYITSNFAKILNKQPPNIENYIANFSNLLILNAKEKKFIKKHKTITMCINPDWTPIEYKENGKPDGISSLVIKKISKLTGLKFKLIKTNSWPESIEYLRKGKCMMLPAASKTQARSKFAVFTHPYLNFPIFIITRRTNTIASSLEDLEGKIVARKKGSALIQLIKKSYPDIKLLQTDNYYDMFKSVENGKAYATLATLPVAKYYIEKYNLKHLSIISRTNIVYHLSIAVNKNYPILRDILDKALYLITPYDINKFFLEQMKEIDEDLYQQKIIKIIVGSVLALTVMLIVVSIIIKKNRELRRIKKQLEESINNFQTIMNNSIQFIILIKDNKIIDINDLACEKTGFKKEELLGRSIFEYVDNKTAKLLEENLKNYQNKPIEIRIRTKENNWIDLLAKIQPVKISSESVLLGVGVDITELKKLQDKLQQLNKSLQVRIEEEIQKSLKKDRMIMQQSKLAATGEMLGMIAHQWKQPLNSISTTINDLLLKLELGMADENYIKSKLSNIVNYINLLNTTINDFMNFYSPDKDKVEVKIEDIIDETLRIVNDTLASANIEVIKYVKCNETLRIYANELKHVLLNLINNAKDALIERKIAQPRIIIKTQCSDNSMHLEIEDNAGGIDEKLLDKVFEAYFTTKHKKHGTGLGLYMTKIIIEEHLNGEIELSNTQYGLRVTIKLPLS
ncbi:ABC transporter substrate-binding protein [Hippea jasoniae]|uniref:ABC transporter substrate-binding protein n=1 Tax=Hippea jasoniae TaxID=944479 RepID=UPI000552017C|nr:ABC transporter substrate-binding protein [Hippea jasoniae]